MLRPIMIHTRCRILGGMDLLGEDGLDAIYRNYQAGEPTMRLMFIGKDPESNPTGSPPCIARIGPPGSCRAGS